MTTALCVFTCNSGNGALERHWKYFLRQEADSDFIIITTNTACHVPPGATGVMIGVDQYLNGDHLPRRLIDTLNSMLNWEWDTLILAEYDTVIFNRLRVEEMQHDLASHYAGGQTWGSKAHGFYHNPWVFKRSIVKSFVNVGYQLIGEGTCGHKTVCSYGSPESSPDVFFAYCAELMEAPVQADLWKEYSRNSYDHPQHLEEARDAYRNGIDVIHGIKTKDELEYITHGNP